MTFLLPPGIKGSKLSGNYITIPMLHSQRCESQRTYKLNFMIERSLLNITQLIFFFFLTPYFGDIYRLSIKSRTRMFTYICCQYHVFPNNSDRIRHIKQTAGMLYHIYNTFRHTVFWISVFESLISSLTSKI